MNVPVLDAELAVKRHPEIYMPEKSERDRERAYLIKNPPIDLDDPFNYQDVYNTVYPLFIDAPSLIFIGRVGEEPVSASFSIYNSSHRAFWYKIKTSLREMFKISTTCGRLEKGSKIVVSVIFYPNVKCPKPFCEYLNIYALLDNLKEENAFDAFRRVDLLRPFKKRLYVDFIWHPNIGITQAYEYGKLLDVLKTRQPALLYNRRKEHLRDVRRMNGKKTKNLICAIAKKDYVYDPGLIDATYQHRQYILDKLMALDRSDINEKCCMPAIEYKKVFAKQVENKDRSRVVTLVKNPPKMIDYKEIYKLHDGSKLLSKCSDELWKEYRKELNERNDKRQEDAEKARKAATSAPKN